MSDESRELAALETIGEYLGSLPNIADQLIELNERLHNLQLVGRDDELVRRQYHVELLGVLRSIAGSL